MRKLRVHPMKSKRKARRGATSTEYILILGGFVIPIALLLPLVIDMISKYGKQTTHILQLPFP